LLDQYGLSRPEREQKEAIKRSIRRAKIGILLDWGYECVVNVLEESGEGAKAEVPAACNSIDKTLHELQLPYLSNTTNFCKIEITCNSPI